MDEWMQDVCQLKMSSQVYNRQIIKMKNKPNQGKTFMHKVHAR